MKEHLKDHSVIHCPGCLKLMSSAAVLRNHFQKNKTCRKHVTHEKSENRSKGQYLCNCGKAFSLPSNLKRHQKHICGTKSTTITGIRIQLCSTKSNIVMRIEVDLFMYNIFLFTHYQMFRIFNSFIQKRISILSHVSLVKLGMIL